jgi:autotransporter-associated beta strand protein
VAGSAANLVWSGTNGSAWDLNSTLNWFNAGIPDVFYNLDRVQFDDTSTNGTANISGAVQPIAMLVSNTAVDYTIGEGEIAGQGSLTKQGTGALMLTSSNSFTGGLVAQGGDILLSNANAAGSAPITLNGGTVTFNGPGLSTYPNALSFLGNSTLISSGGGNNTISGTWSGGSGITANMNITGFFSVTGSMLNYLGTVAFGNSGGNFRVNVATGATFDASNTSFDLGTRTTTLMNRNGSVVYLGSLTGGAGTVLAGSGSVDAPSTYIIGTKNLSTTFAGAIQDGSYSAAPATSIVKAGSGTLTLTGSSTFSAGTTVNAGTLRVDNASGSATGSGDLFVATGATLTGSGFIGSPTTLDDGAILAPGDTTGTLTINNDLTLSDNTSLQFELGTNSDTVLVGGALHAAGIINVTNAGGFGPGSYVLFNYNPANNFDTGNLTVGNVPSGYNYSISTNTPGQVTLVVAPPLTAFQQWQIAYFGSTNNPAGAPDADADGDGMNNYAEFLAGTNPTNSSSLLKITSATVQTNDIAITWKTAGPRTNIIQATSPLANGFTDVTPGIVIAGTGDAVMNFVLQGEATNGMRFYRVRLGP